MCSKSTHTHMQVPWSVLSTHTCRYHGLSRAHTHAGIMVCPEHTHMQVLGSVKSHTHHMLSMCRLVMELLHLHQQDMYWGSEIKG